ncbi:TlpA family protein disulfide reductase [Thalassomonas actiniarum]|uniref:TlpA family protein disulfide reductase n=1 Tax=Thalassomonas actiniarum TaxID=485447 RepID=A0AAE9YWV9_9GAMM|nr:TlpA disulfide reductase family protein [Thalassomonas actiniarum]WDE02676.1 TlpA family protein disulfide reductase [Thalassomonas actiniarum]
MKILITFCFCLLANLPAAATAYRGDSAADFTISEIGGSEFQLSDFKGKQAVYLIFWATWCPNCKREIPKLKEIHANYSGDIKMLAINTSINDSLKKVKRYINKHALTYPVAYDTERKVTKLYGVMGTPTQLVIDINGVIQYRSAEVPDDLAEHLERLLTVKSDTAHAE